jgi:hypothetical protein
MADIFINEDLVVKGKMSLNRSQTPEGAVVIQGQLSCKTYVEEITKIETLRYSITGVEVFSEAFGSEEDEIIYTFTALDLAIKYEYAEDEEDNIVEEVEAIAGGETNE